MAEQEDLEQGGAEMTFTEHIVELRRLLVRAAILFGLVAIIFFMMKGVVVDWVFAPMSPDFPTNRFFDWLAGITDVDALRINQTTVELYNNKMAGQFSLHIRSSVIGALVVTFPYIIYQLWSFVKPALSDVVRSQTKRIVWEVSMWFFIGFFFGYYCISPLAANFLIGYEVSPTVQNIIDVSSYMSTVMGVSFAAALIFQLPLLVRLLSSIGLMKAEFMRKYRKVAAAVLLVLSAIITPPDVFSQVLIFIPLYLLYEYGITIAVKIEKRKAEQEE
ncbi:Twin-arginine translocation protein TatC [Mucinivorans hirudinis]|uniref:Sec-independent protein translocase protein TatC n=1 Tax=Mucinivorans hirudinis TaxID=1433126 RepID=A0A060RD16_9BACT|nr:Twin-arginine translocation protein TatC [Mucinivorans hirudinis]